MWHSYFPQSVPTTFGLLSLKTRLAEQLVLQLGPARDPFLGPLSKLSALPMISKWVGAFKIQTGSPIIAPPYLGG